jgi:SAM-dependent methyltransferase
VEKNDFNWHSRFLQQAAWTKPLRDFLFDQVDLGTPLRVLEVGCGTGALLEDVESRFAGDIFGLDINPEYLAQASRHARRSRLLIADAHALPFPSDSFNIVFCHFLLLWVNNPRLVVHEMRRLARPGGFVMALAEPDYGGRMDYPFELSTMGELQKKSLRQQGANPLLGRQLSDFFIQAGLHKVESGLLGGEWKSASSDAQFDMEWKIFEQDLEYLPDRLAHAELAALKRLDSAARKAGSRILFVPTFYAWGQK